MAANKLSWKNATRMFLTALLGGCSAWWLLGPPAGGEKPSQARQGPQLVRFEPLPMECLEWPAGLTPVGRAYASERSVEASLTNRAPVRVLRDDRPTFSAVAVDPARNEVVVQDENLFQILVYNRLDNTPPQAAMTEPKRVIGGIKTKVEFNCGLYVDPRTGEIYSVNNDTVDTLVVFSRQAEGNVEPDRELHTPHGTYGIAVDEVNQELYLTVQHDSAIVVYRKQAAGEEPPLRLIQGDKTQLADPHGIVVDTKRDLIFVANHGSVHQVRPEAGPAERRRRPNWPLDRNYGVPGSGQLLPPSITVYPRTAAGDVAPVAVIQGDRTLLNWPASMAIDEERGEIYVANDTHHSILVFKVTDNGNVSPSRIIKGPNTGIQNPTGVSLDLTHQELWVSNFGNHSVTVYPLDADGDVRPLRTIRAAPAGKMAMSIGNPGAVAYDSKRREVLVPN